MTPLPFKQPSSLLPGSQPEIQNQVAGQISNPFASSPRISRQALASPPLPWLRLRMLQASIKTYLA